MENNIFIQDGCIIHTLRPSSVAHARIFSEEQRAKIKQLLHHNFSRKGKVNEEALEP